MSLSYSSLTPKGDDRPLIADLSEFEPSGCCGSSVSIYVGASILEIVLALGLVITASAFLGVGFSASLLIPSCILGFPFGFIMILGAIFTIRQAYTGAKYLPIRSEANTRVIVLWCLLVSSILLEIGLLVCTALTYREGVVKSGVDGCYDSCGIWIGMMSISLVFLVISIVTSILYIPLLYRATRIRNFVKA